MGKVLPAAGRRIKLRDFPGWFATVFTSAVLIATESTEIAINFLSVLSVEIRVSVLVFATNYPNTRFVLFALPAAGNASRLIPLRTHPSTLMNSPASSRRRGFTLIELLVVIAIIVVLAAASFSGGIMAINSAKKTASVATAKALEHAVNNFYTEYGSLPDVPERVQTDGGEGVRLLNILLGLDENSSKVQNSRLLKLLQAAETKTKTKGGLLYSANGRSAEGLYDSWGNPFHVQLDVNYEERLRVSLGSKTELLNGRRVAVYSPGADKQLGTSDDVKSW